MAGARRARSLGASAACMGSRRISSVTCTSPIASRAAYRSSSRSRARTRARSRDSCCARGTLLCASPNGRRRMDTVTMSKPSLIVRIPTPLWLLALILAALALGALLEAPAILQYRPAGVVLILAGLGLGVWAALTFRKLRAQIKPHSDVHGTLVSSGPFQFSRNPMYLGNVMIGVGAALLAGTWLMWLVP